MVIMRDILCMEFLLQIAISTIPKGDCAGNKHMWSMIFIWLSRNWVVFIHIKVNFIFLFWPVHVPLPKLLENFANLIRRTLSLTYE